MNEIREKSENMKVGKSGHPVAALQASMIYSLTEHSLFQRFPWETDRNILWYKTG